MQDLTDEPVPFPSRRETQYEPIVSFVRTKQAALEAKLDGHERAIYALLDGWHECRKTDDELGCAPTERGQMRADRMRLGYLLGSVKQALACLNAAAPPADGPWPTAEELR